MEIDTAVILNAGRFLRHGADIVALIGVRRISEANAERRFEDFLGALHRLLPAAQSRQYRPKLRR